MNAPPNFSHNHSYKRDNRPDWPGYLCTVCAFRYPCPSTEIRKSRPGGATFSEEIITAEELEAAIPVGQKFNRYINLSRSRRR